MNGLFQTHTMTLAHSLNPVNGVVARGLSVQLDPVNLDIQMMAQGLIPVDLYDCITNGWTEPVPIRSDYLIDEATGDAYSMYSTVYKGVDNLQFRCAKTTGKTP